ncbi:serine hydrolase domain-containing protein [Gelidibacter japonicus]|uniref:serine hydrolase domain-containing protein n=1 Tax=Gelidibacter japonicus TaxID=1962232 RepID=UPI0013D566CA|nr:serine hydrolase [Gelidibacter japonicus]
MPKKIILSFISLLLLYHTSFGQNKNDKEKLISEINTILQASIDNSKIPGAVILIKQGNQEIHKKAYGYASIKEFNHQILANPEKTTVDHLYDIASLTKVIGTTTSIMLLVDSGLINIEDPVVKYIKAFDSPEKSKITIGHLLSHTSGLYEWYPLYYFGNNKQEVYKLIDNLPLKYPVGGGRHYSDLGFILLGEIVETVSKLTLEQFMYQNIFKPLKMEHTMFNPLKNGIEIKISATSHGNPYEKRMVSDPVLGFSIDSISPDQWNGWRNYTLKGEVNDGNAWYASNGISGHAGLFSTVSDLQKVLDVLKNNGQAGNLQFISEKTISLFLTQDKFKNGLGWAMDATNSFMKNAPSGSYGHTGFTGTSIVVIPQYDLSIVLLINRQNMGLLLNRSYYNLSPIREQIFRAVMTYCNQKKD